MGRPAALAAGWALACGATAFATAAPGAPTGLARLPSGSFQQRVCDTPRYPHEAKSRGWTGTVVLRFDASADGKVTHATVERSSGHAVLDAAALASLQTCRFQPVVRDGVAVAASDRVEYVWVLNDNVMEARLPAQSAAQGEPSDVKKAVLSGQSAVPPAARDEVLRDLQYRATLDAGCSNLEAARFEPASADGAVRLPPPGKGMLQDVRDLYERWQVRQCGQELIYLITFRLHGDSLVRHHAQLEGARTR
jgi:TonB family protein